MSTNTTLMSAFLLLACGFGLNAQGYCERFETDDGGWVASGRNSSWEWGQPAGAAIVGEVSRGSAWVTNLSGDYNVLELSFLTSPVIDLSSYATDPELRFSHNFSTGRGETWVEVAIDGGPFLKLGNAQPGSFKTNWYNDVRNDWWDSSSSGWRNAAHPLPGTAGKSIQLRFVMSADTSGTEEGVAVDDVEIHDVAPTDDVGVAWLNSPRTAVGLGLATVSVTIENFGSSLQTSFPIAFAVDGGQWVEEQWTGNLPPQGRTAFTFAAPADLSAPGAHTVLAETRHPTDSNVCNDAADTRIANIPVVDTFPYLEGFEASDGAFYSEGRNSSWAVGAVQKPFIPSAANGNRAWSTSLTGNNSLNELSYLYTPVFDFTALAPGLVPEIVFSQIYSLSSDEAWMEISLDGVVWQKFGFSGSGTNWYLSSTETWRFSSAASGEWRTASQLAFAAVGNNAQFRFVIDATRANPGMAIDDFQVRVTQPTIITDLPYLEDFENGPGSFRPGGFDPSWEWGVPAGALISSAASGTGAWVTNLKGSANNNERSFLESPTFDFTNLSPPLIPVVEFSMASGLSSFRGYAFMEISVNGGVWQKLGAAGTGQNWYNDPSNQWWERSLSALGEWVTVQQPLYGLQGSQARFRIVVDGDDSHEGIGVDDFAIKFVQPEMRSVFPDIENFEFGAAGFVADGTNSSWVLAKPSGSFITGAASRETAWVTNASGTYNPQELSYLTSPVLDFTGLPATSPDPALKFQLIRQLGSGDYLWVERSINGGAWLKLGFGNTGTNWYNNAPNRRWAGTSLGVGTWRFAQHAITGAVGNYVQLRFVFQSDNSAFGDEGAGIDDFEIICSQCPKLYAGNNLDLVLKSSINFDPVSRVDLKSIEGGDLLNFHLVSPGLRLVGRPWALTLASFDYQGGAVIPEVLPGLYLGDSSIALTFAGFGLPAAGANLSFTWPVGLTNASVLVQGVVLPDVGPRSFVSSDGHVIDQAVQDRPSPGPSESGPSERGRAGHR